MKTKMGLELGKDITIQEWIRTGPYDEVMELFLHWYLGAVPANAIQEWLLDRIDAKDLPLFINFPWSTQEDFQPISIKQRFINRLSRGTPP